MIDIKIKYSVLAVITLITIGAVTLVHGGNSSLLQEGTESRKGEEVSINPVSPLIEESITFVNLTLNMTEMGGISATGIFHGEKIEIYGSQNINLSSLCFTPFYDGDLNFHLTFRGSIFVPKISIIAMCNMSLLINTIDGPQPLVAEPGARFEGSIEDFILDNMSFVLNISYDLVEWKLKLSVPYMDTHVHFNGPTLVSGNEFKWLGKLVRWDIVNAALPPFIVDLISHSRDSLIQGAMDIANALLKLLVNGPSSPVKTMFLTKLPKIKLC